MPSAPVTLGSEACRAIGPAAVGMRGWLGKGGRGPLGPKGPLGIWGLFRTYFECFMVRYAAVGIMDKFDREPYSQLTTEHLAFGLKWSEVVPKPRFGIYSTLEPFAVHITRS